MLYEGSEGDCRRCINLLQATAAISPSITADLVSTIISNTKPKDIKIVLDYAIAGDFQKAREKLFDIMLKESISGQDVIKSIQKEIWNLPVEPEIKVKLTEKTGEAEFRIVEGSDPFIQLQALLASFVLPVWGRDKMPWVEIYRPKRFSEIKGQNDAIDKIKTFLKNFGKGKNALILYGPPGTGKTTLAYAAAAETNSEIFELNASDLRNKEKLREILRPALEQTISYK